MHPRDQTKNKLWSKDLLQAPHAAADKAGRVRGMFNAIAPRYQLVNTVFSAGRDASWRRKAVELARVGHQDLVLDLACGTGDFARTFAAAKPARVIGCDFAHQMLIRAARNWPSGPGSLSPAAAFIEADALSLPFAPSEFTIVSCAFGVRNFADLDAGLREIHRVLLPAGRAVILEFTRPPNRVFRRLYEFYANSVMPRAATLLSGDRSGAYRYLPRSVVSFLTADQMVERLTRAGFTRIGVHPLTMGVVTVYVAHRA